jgi:hypothetical protein
VIADKYPAYLHEVRTSTGSVESAQ